MRLPVLGCLLVFLTPIATEAGRFTPGIAFTVTLQSEKTGATATMTWSTHRTCAQFQPFEFLCLGRWQCDGDACPGHGGRLWITFEQDGFHQVTLHVTRRRSCAAQFVAFVARISPYDGSYRCLASDPTTEIDSGTATIRYEPPPSLRRPRSAA